ncbi:MAG: hypothetical protein ACYTJ0_17785, partial [Planctomycetota bacterium]
MGLDFESRTLLDALQRAAGMVTAFYEGLEDRPVTPVVSRDELRAALGGTLGEEGVGLDRALDEVERIVLPAAMGTPHPGYLGLVNSS